MTWHGWAAVAGLVGTVLTLACSGGAPARPNPAEESPLDSSPSTSRPPAPEVTPVDHGGVRYQEDRSDERQGDQAGGYLVAVDLEKKIPLWRLKVYDVPDHRAAGVEMGGLHFRSIRLMPGGSALEIENEAGSIYRVDLVKRTSTRVSGPPAATPKPVAPAKPMPE